MSGARGLSGSRCCDGECLGTISLRCLKLGGMAISGSCLCGDVRFEIDKAVGPVEICHCNGCRKTTGSGSLPAIGVMTEDYRLLACHELVKT